MRIDYTLNIVNNFIRTAFWTPQMNFSVRIGVRHIKGQFVFYHWRPMYRIQI